MKVLNITIRGETYKINEKGEISGGPNEVKPSGDWLFLGVSFHHWRTGIDRTFKEIWEQPRLAIKGLLWDQDHYMVRQWLGRYNGRLPRITAAWTEE